jgi:hypothetical protein
MIAWAPILRQQLHPAHSRAGTLQALLAILCRLGAGSLTTDPPALEAASTSAPAMDPRVEAFLRAQPEATSIPFISWLADLEAATPAGASEKAQLAAMCSWLLAFRDLLDREGQEAMHADALAVLAGACVVRLGQRGQRAARVHTVCVACNGCCVCACVRSPCNGCRVCPALMHAQRMAWASCGHASPRQASTHNAARP